MKAAFSAIDLAIKEVGKCRRTLSRGQSGQVRAIEELSLIKATAYAWFNNHREELLTFLDAESLTSVDSAYSELLAAADRATSRSRYPAYLGSIRNDLRSLRTAVISAEPVPKSHSGTTDKPPNISKLVPDPSTQDAIQRRWIECTRCINSRAPLAALVMMGGLLEGLLLARVNSERNKAQIFAAAAAPINPKTGNPRLLKEWTLMHFIDVAHELKWISRSAKDVAEVLRDYRNYIHPYKELSHGVALTTADARVLWEVTKSLSLQVISSV